MQQLGRELPLNQKEEEEEVPITMAASAELRVDQLPADPLLHILSFLSFRDLIKYVTDYLVTNGYRREKVTVKMTALKK